MSSIGSSTRSSQATNSAEDDDRDGERRRASTPLPQPCSGAWISPYTRLAMPTMDSTAPTGSSGAFSRIA